MEIIFTEGTRKFPIIYSFGSKFEMVDKWYQVPTEIYTGLDRKLRRLVRSIFGVLEPAHNYSC